MVPSTAMKYNLRLNLHQPHMSLMGVNRLPLTISSHVNQVINWGWQQETRLVGDPSLLWLRNLLHIAVCSISLDLILTQTHMHKNRLTHSCMHTLNLQYIIPVFLSITITLLSVVFKQFFIHNSGACRPDAIVGQKWSIEETSISVKWQPVKEPSSRKGPVKEYRVRYIMIDGQDKEHVVRTKQPEFQLSGLRSNTRVRFDISAVSSCGMEGPAKLFHQTTSELDFRMSLYPGVLILVHYLFIKLRHDTFQLNMFGFHVTQYAGILHNKFSLKVIFSFFIPKIAFAWILKYL